MSGENLFRSANQIQEVGNPNPPNMSRVPEAVLDAASPDSFNLADTTRVNLDASDRAERSCASYTGIDGLRRLQRDQQNRSYLDAGCGWIYKPSNGITPEINRGALGRADGPSRSTMSSGTKWMWDLDDAEKEISTKICTSVTKCRNMAALGQFTSVCGFCKTTGAMIPVIQQSGGINPRYPNDPSLTCEPENIVTVGRGSCPREGFLDMNGEGMGTNTGRFNTTEGFTIGQTADDLFDNCSKGPLSRDCVVLAARISGCSDNGTLIRSLNGAPRGGSYDTVLKDKNAFRAYQDTANPNITRAMVQDGSTSLEVALSDFQRLLGNTTARSDKLRFAARDLCLMEKEYDNYNFCAELKDTTRITKDFLPCLERSWRQQGGTPNGTLFSSIRTFEGKAYSAFNAFVSDILKRIDSTDKNKNAQGIREFIGVETGTSISTLAPLPRNDDTRGAETVWIHFEGRPIIILRSDLRLAKDGEVIPSFTSREQLVQKYRVPAYNIAFTNTFEVRPDVDETNLQYQITSDDGFMISKNQNPFEKTVYSKFDSGSWKFQAPTTSQGSLGMIPADKKGENSVIVMKWFQGGGGAFFKPLFYFSSSNNMRWSDPSTEAPGRQNFYLTQEPLAPWLQYEVCTRPNNDRTSTGFFEKRFNGTPAVNVSESFDVQVGSVAYITDKNRRIELPQEKAYMQLTTQSFWNTRAMFGFTAFKTITLLVRPEANLADGASVSIFQHINFTNTFGTGLFLRRAGNRYFINHWVGSRTSEHPLIMNAWNLIVLQYIGDGNVIRNITCNVFEYTVLQTNQGRRGALQTLTQRQSGSGPVLYVSATQNKEHAGHLVLGGANTELKDTTGKKITWASQSFRGDVAWIHGFRNYIDSDAMLRAEIQQTWISRWPRSNIDGEPKETGLLPSDFVMYGNWIGADTQVQQITSLPSGERVFMIEQGGYTKMVTEDNKVAKYYTGRIRNFDGNRWNSYSADATGKYLVKKK